jgi:DNA-directed RNA polymerase specialized sigma24 family protein
VLPVLDASTEELFRKFLRDRDPASHERLVRAYRPLVASVCRRFLQRDEDVDDAVQETFLKLAQHAHTIRGSPTSWLLATAYSTAGDLIRRTLRERRRARAVDAPGAAGRAATTGCCTNRSTRDCTMRCWCWMTPIGS